jgi:hypothetical protein
MITGPENPLLLRCPTLAGNFANEFLPASAHVTVGDSTEAQSIRGLVCALEPEGPRLRSFLGTAART